MNKLILRAISTNRNFLIMLIASIGMLPEFVAYGNYYIGGDYTHQMLPFVYETKRMFSSGAPFWSWNTYFGDNFIASYAYYTVFNPFTWINCLFPYKYLGLGFTLVLYLKFLVCGYVSQKYLKKIGFEEKLSLIGCLLYTFSSWAISNLIFYMFMEPMILFPFLLIFVERFFHRDRYAYTGLTLATFIVVVINYYFSSINLIAAAIYFFCRLPFFCKKGKDRLLATLKAFACIVLGIVCASFMLIPVLLQLKGATAQSMNFDTSDIYMIADRIFWLIYPKAHEGRFFYILLNSGWKSNAVGIALFGILPVILLFTKKGYGWIKWLTAILFVVYITPLNGIFSLFTDFYYTRWAYALTLAIILCTLFYLKDFGVPRMKYAVWYCLIFYGFFVIFCGASVIWQYEASETIYSQGVIRLLMDGALALVNIAALLFLCRNGLKANDRYYVIVCSIVVCTSFQFILYSIPDSYILSSDYSDLTETEYFIQNEDFIREDEFQYRTNFTVINTGGRPSSNFGIITNRPSIETYHSIQNSKIEKWNSIVGGPDPKRVFFPVNHVKSFEALMSVKDLVIVSKAPIDPSLLNGTMKKNGLFTLYESDHYIPMGFAYDNYIISEELEELIEYNDSVDVPMIVLSSLAINKSDEKELMPYLNKREIDLNDNLDSIVIARRAVTCDSFSGHTRGFDAHINLDSASVVFFSVVADDGFKAYIDGEPTKIYETNFGFTSVIVPAGSHDITLRYFPPGLKIGLIFSAFGLSLLAFMCYKRF